MLASAGPDRIVIVPAAGATGTAAAAAAAARPLQDAQMADHAAAHINAPTGIAADGYWNSSSDRMAITDDVCF